jgi:hypothetical protein
MQLIQTNRNKSSFNNPFPFFSFSLSSQICWTSSLTSFLYFPNSCSQYNLLGLLKCQPQLVFPRSVARDFPMGPNCSSFWMLLSTPSSKVFFYPAIHVIGLLQIPLLLEKVPSPCWHILLCMYLKAWYLSRLCTWSSSVFTYSYWLNPSPVAVVASCLLKSHETLSPISLLRSSPRCQAFFQYTWLFHGNSSW